MLNLTQRQHRDIHVSFSVCVGGCVCGQKERERRKEKGERRKETGKGECQPEWGPN
jgi:hypothetical protein